MLLPFTSLRFTDMVFFLQIEGLWQLCIKQVYQPPSAIPTAFAHFMSLYHILVIFTVFQTLHQQNDYSSLKAQIMVSIFQQ